MNDKKKGMLKLLLILALTAITGLISILGIGTDKIGSMSKVKLGLDLAGGVSITYQATKPNPTQEEMNDTVYRMQKRAEIYSSEATAYQEGSNRINVDIPSATDANEVLQQLGKAGSIYFILGQSNDGTANLLTDSNGNFVRDEEGLLMLSRDLSVMIAAGDVVIDGSDISSAEPTTGDSYSSSRYLVRLTLNSSGTDKFAKATTYAAGYNDLRNIIMIVYDGKVVSAPGVQNAITGGEATISGQSSYDEAKQLASTIRIGALPLELFEIRSNVVGAKLGSEAIDTSLLAGIIGFIIVVIFMIAYYRIPGLAASIALTLYTFLMIVLLNIFNVTLTLPGIAGIILSIGMAVDANVIIFERIREELATGKTVRSGIKIGFNKALSAIVDGNVTTLIAAAVLFLRGTGTVKGFAETLAIGIVLSMFTALVITKFILHALYAVGCDKEKMYGVKSAVKVIDFVKHAKKFVIFSCTVILIGFAALIVNKVSSGDVLNFGLDFKGGSSMQVTFPEELPNDILQQMENLFDDELGIISEPVRVQGENTVIIKTRTLTSEENIQMQERFVNDYNVDKSLIQTNTISATVSGEMKSDAVWALIIAGIGMLIYIWIRFKDIGYAASSIIPLIHDVLTVLMLYAVTKISVGSTFIACMLTLVGYSINATIVIFDRIKENMKEKLKKDTVKDIVNLSISQSVSRSINTSLTTLIMVLVLSILGVDSVREFSIPLLFGVVMGTYSSVCIAGNLWYLFYKLRNKAEV